MDNDGRSRQKKGVAEGAVVVVRGRLGYGDTLVRWSGMR